MRFTISGLQGENPTAAVTGLVDMSQHAVDTAKGIPRLGVIRISFAYAGIQGLSFYKTIAPNEA